MSALQRIERDKMIAGVCSGIGRSVGIDAYIVRLAFAIFTLLGGAGIALYVVCWLLMPRATGGFAAQDLAADIRRWSQDRKYRS